MIFCVEDDREIRDLMLYALGSAGFEARGFADGEAFFRGLEEARPELVMLDIMLPGEDGIEILKKDLPCQTHQSKLHLIPVTSYLLQSCP